MLCNIRASTSVENIRRWRYMYSVKDDQMTSIGLSGEGKISRLSIRGQLVVNVLWFALNAQSAALLPIVIPTQIVLFISSKQIGGVQQVVVLIGLRSGASIMSLLL